MIGYIKLGCYNVVSNEAIIIPFNSNGYFYYNNNKIEAVYFDDGIARVLINCDEANNLIKLANGAKNIYLFKFELIKKDIRIEGDLGILSDREQVTRDRINNYACGSYVSNDYDWGNCYYRTTD